MIFTTRIKGSEFVAIVGDEQGDFQKHRGKKLLGFGHDKNRKPVTVLVNGSTVPLGDFKEWLDTRLPGSYVSLWGDFA